MGTSAQEKSIPKIPGYAFGSPESAHSPLLEKDVRELEQTIGWTEQDASLLRQHGDVFREQAEAMVDAWRVKPRFVQWVIDTATRPHDQAWLDYQEEIGLRHTPAKKNNADERHTPPMLPLRFVLGFLPAVTNIRKFLEGRIADEATLKAVERAWSKAVLLEVVLWARPYTRDGLW